MDPIKDLYAILKATNIFIDEQDLRNQIRLNPRDVFSVVQRDKKASGLFIDFDDFINTLNPGGKDKLKKLHDNLLKEGYDLPDYATFETDIADPVKRKKLHESLLSEGYDLPEFGVFSEDMGFIKKYDEYGIPIRNKSSEVIGSLRENVGAGLSAGAGLDDGSTPDGFAGRLGQRAGEVSDHKQSVLKYMQRLKEPVNKVDLTAGVSQKPVLLTKGFKKQNSFTLSVDEDIHQAANQEINSIMLDDSDEWKDPLKALSERAEKAATPRQRTIFNHGINISLGALAPDGFEALRVLSSSYWGISGKGNKTAEVLRSRANDYLSNTSHLRSIPFPESMEGATPEWFSYNMMPYLRSAAIKWYADKNRNFGEQLAEKGVNPDEPGVENIIGDGKLGQIMNEFLLNKDVVTFTYKENPAVKPALEYAYKANIVEHPEWGKSVVANEVSRAMMKSGYNAIDPIFNYWGKTSREVANLTAEDIFKEQPDKLKIYNDHIRDNQEAYLDAPSFFERFSGAGKQFFEGVKSTFTTPFQSVDSAIKEKWKQEAGAVTADPQGFLKFLYDTGHATGFVASIGAGSNIVGGIGIINPKNATAIATATAFLGDNLEEAKMKFPESPVKQWTSALFNTGLYAALSYDLFPADKAMLIFSKVKPEVNSVVEQLTTGVINKAGARKQMEDILMKAAAVTGEAVKINAKMSAEMAGLATLNKMLDSVMGMDSQTFEQYHPENEETETFKAMFLSNSLVAGMSAAGKISQRNRVAEESIYEAASNPKFYARIIDEMSVRDPDINISEIRDNLSFLVNVKNGLDKIQVSAESQKKYLVHAIRQKVAEETVKAVSDPVIQKEISKEVVLNKEMKENILSGKANTEPSPEPEILKTEGINSELAQESGVKKTDRIPVSPIIGQKPLPLSDIMGEATKALNQKLLFVKPDSKRAAGTYSPGSTAIKLRNSNDLDVFAHELSHSIDDKFKFSKNADQDVKNELLQFSPYGSKPPKGHPDPQAYTLAEGVAEFIRAMVVNPDAARLQAPRTAELYDRVIPVEVRDVVSNLSNNVRILAGATGKDIILSNVEIEPKKEGIIQTLLNELKKDSGFSITWADRLTANMLNPLRAFNKAFEYAKGIKGIDDVLPENDPTVLARLMSGYEGKFGEILKSGMINSRNDLLYDQQGNTKNLNWLLEPLKDVTQDAVNQNMEAVASYMIAERTVELAGKFERGYNITGIGAGLFSDLSVAIKALQEFDALPEQKRQQITEATERYRQMAGDVLRYLVDKGRLSESQYEQIIKDNTHYVALQRIIETGPNQEIEVYHEKKRSLGSSSTPVHEIKGSVRKIQNPYISLLDSIYRSIREADRNEVLKSFRDMLVSDRMMGEGEPEPLAEIGVRVKDGEKNTIPIFINGKRELWQFQQDVYEALKGFDSDGWRFHPFMTAHARLLRWSVTHWPVFAARNWVRDFQDRLIKSNENNWYSGITNIVGKKEDWASLARSGGLNAGYYMRDREHYYGLMKEGLKELDNQGNVIADVLSLKNVWKKYENLLFSGETSNRVAEYRSAFNTAKNKGMDDFNASLYAADKARGLIDFAVAGHYMKLINQLVPFSNAAVQGLRSSFSRMKENPKGFAIRMALYTTIPQMAVWLLNHKDEETSAEYENLPPWQRDLAWNFKIAPNRWLSIPKPFELALPSAGTDRLMSYLAGSNDEAFKGFAGSVARGFIPVDESALAGPFAPFVETITNYDFFRKKQIVPPHEVTVDLSLRNTETSSKLGRLLQKYLNVDARKIDHVIKSQFSYFGDVVLKASNINEDKKKASFSINDIGFFKESPGYNAQVVQEFLSEARKWRLTGTKQYKYFNGLVEQYFNAENDIEKEKLGALLIETAGLLLKDIERSGIKDIRKEVHDEKIKQGQ